MRKNTITWFWLVPILLLATFLAARGLDSTGLWHDEIWSYSVAGGDYYGPLSLSEVWQRVAVNDPTQGMGYPLVLAEWGALVGWTPYAARALSLLVGVLSIAMVYRLGSDVISRRAGLYAALLLSVSAFYIYYMHEVRAYAPVILFGAMLLWSYWRILTKSDSGWMISVCCVVGGVGLLYTNYYTVILLLALALYHLLVVSKTRRWWKPVILALIVAVLFVPALQAFLRGYGNYTTWSDIRNLALSPLQLLTAIFNFAGNGQILLLILFIALALWAAIQNIESPRGTRFILFLTVTVAFIGVVMNAIMLVIDNSRVRYVLTLWIPLMICLGAGLDWLSRQTKIGKWLATGALAFWLAGGFQANFDPAFLHDITGGTRLRWQTMTDILRREGLPEDVFAFYAGDYNWDTWFTFDFATHTLPFPSFVTFTLQDETNRDWAYTSLQNARRVWYGIDPTKPVTTDAYDAMQKVLDADFKLCRDDIVVRPDMRLMLYARSTAFCPATPSNIGFGDKIFLNVEIVQAESMLTLNIGVTSAADVPLDTYSLAVHVTDSSGNLVAQSDSGIPDGHFAAMQPHIALDGLPAGTYTVNLIVYNWQSGERLTGTNLQTGVTGDRVPAGEITIR